MDHYQHALKLCSQGKIEESITQLQTLLSENPTHFAGWNTLGQVRLTQRRYDDALAFFTESARLQPGIFTAHLNIVQTLRTQKHYDLAKDYLTQILADHPNLTQAWKLMRDICAESYDSDGFTEACHRLGDLEDKLMAALSLPVVLEKDEADYLVTFDQNIAECQSLPPSKGLPKSVPNSIFQLAYFKENPRSRLEAISNLYRALYPDLNYISPNSYKKPSAKPKIGIITAFLDKFHAVGFCYATLVKELSKIYEIVYFRLPTSLDMPSTTTDLGVKKTRDLSHDLRKNRQIIDSQQVDILWYLDINMGPDTYFLAHSRLAPIQIVSAGHPCTTGISTIDYFISSQYLEPQGAPDHYTEKLIQLSTLPMIYQDYDGQDLTSNRAAFGLPDDKHLYFCAQTLFKIHPKIDILFKEILESDDKAVIVFSYGGTLLADKLKYRLGTMADRCLFIPTVPQHVFFHLLASVDVILDTTPFGSGNTLCQSLAVGTPTVCFEIKDLRGAGAPGLYRLMGIEDTITESDKDYVELAVKIAKSPQLRHDLKSRILAQKHKIFENDRDIITAYQGMFAEL